MKTVVYLKADLTTTEVTHESQNIEHDSCLMMMLRVGDDMDYPSDNKSATNLMEWRLKASKKFPLTTDSSFEPLCNPNSPTHHDANIKDFVYELVMLRTTSKEVRGD